MTNNLLILVQGSDYDSIPELKPEMIWKQIQTQQKSLRIHITSKPARQNGNFSERTAKCSTKCNRILKAPLPSYLVAV